MTTQVEQIISRIFDKTAEQNLSLSKVHTNVFNAVIDAASKSDDVIKYLVPKDADAKKAMKADMFNKFLKRMPHIVEAGTDKVIACDMVEADPEKEYTRAFTACRTSVDEDVVEYDTAVTMAQAKRECNKIEKVKFASGYEMEMPARDKEGKVIKEERLTNLVPREKTQWGYTSVVKKAIILSIQDWEKEQGLA
jgi:hypothetical protein